MALLLGIFFLLALLSGAEWAWWLVFLGVIWLFFRPLFWIFAVIVLGLVMYFIWRVVQEWARPTPRRVNHYINPAQVSYHPSDTNPKPKKKRSSGRPRFYRPIRQFRYTKYARTRSAINFLERLGTPRKSRRKPRVGETKTENGKTYRFSESRRWKREK